MSTPPETACACVAGGRTAHSPASQLGDRANGPVPQVVVTCSAAARRVPADLRTRSVWQIQRDTSASWARVAAQLKPMKRHCFARCAKQAEPPPTRNRSVWRYAVRRGMPRPERVAQTCGDTWRNRSAWRSRAAAACDRFASRLGRGAHCEAWGIRATRRRQCSRRDTQVWRCAQAASHLPALRGRCAVCAADQLYGRAALRAGPCLRPTAWLPGRRRCASGSRGSPRR